MDETSQVPRKERLHVHKVSDCTRFYAPKAEVISEHWRLHDGPLRVDGAAQDVIQAPKPEPQIMRYELSDYEWTPSSRCCQTSRRVRVDRGVGQAPALHIAADRPRLAAHGGRAARRLLCCPAICDNASHTVVSVAYPRGTASATLTGSPEIGTMGGAAPLPNNPLRTADLSISALMRN
jgi:hypothetical protein